MKLSWLIVAVVLFGLSCSVLSAPSKGERGQRARERPSKPVRGGPVDWAKSSKKRRSKGARKAHGRKARREAESRRDEKKERPNHDELMATRKFFDATAMGKQTNSSSAFRSKKIGAKQAKALEQIAKLGERQQKAWAAIVYKGPGIPRLDENFKKAMKETQAIEQELLQIASSGEIGKNLMIRKKINLPRRGRGGKKGKPEKFPIRDQAHLDVVETSFKHRASKLDVKQRDALLGELTKYVTAAGRLLAYKDLVVEVKKEEQHDKSIEQEFGKRYSKTLKQIQLKKEGEEGKQRRESRQKKYTAATQHHRALWAEASTLRRSLEQRVKHMEL